MFLNTYLFLILLLAIQQPQQAFAQSTAQSTSTSKYPSYSDGKIIKEELPGYELSLVHVVCCFLQKLIKKIKSFKVFKLGMHHYKKNKIIAKK